MLKFCRIVLPGFMAVFLAVHLSGLAPVKCTASIQFSM